MVSSSAHQTVGEPAIPRITLKEIFTRLMNAYGPQHWWPISASCSSSGGAGANSTDPTGTDPSGTDPCGTGFQPVTKSEGQAPEIVVGAILTQNTVWTNVEKAIARLHTARMLNWRALCDIRLEKLQELVKPCGTYRIKSERLKAFAQVLCRDYDGRLEKLCTGDLKACRDRLLAIPGIGPETADAILLYAAGRPSFVVDAYTMRILRRHFYLSDAEKYEQVRLRFQHVIPPDTTCYNEYHALLVELGKRHCRSRANCMGCPLEDLPHDPDR